MHEKCTICAYTLSDRCVSFDWEEEMNKTLKEKIDSAEFVPAVVCYLVRGSEVLLIRRKKVSLGLGENLIAGIGGKVGDSEETKQETAEEALLREVQEEIGVTPLVYKKMGFVRFFWEGRPGWNMCVKAFIVEGWDGEPQETESAEPIWFAKDKLPLDLMWEDNRHWVPKVLSGDLVDAVFIYGEDKKLSSFSIDQVVVL